MSNVKAGGNFIACPSLIGNTAGTIVITGGTYVAEDGTTFYVAEDGTTFYVQESTIITGGTYSAEDGVTLYVAEDGTTFYVQEI